jgi:hypothetical protein
MKKLFEIDNSEKQRILEMHQNATKKNYLSEQNTPNKTDAPAQGKTYFTPEQMGLTQENLNYILANSDQTTTFTFPGNKNLYLLEYGKSGDKESFNIVVITLGPVYQRGNNNVKLGIQFFYRGKGTISIANKKIWQLDTPFAKAWGEDDTSQEALNNFVAVSSIPSGINADANVIAQYVNDSISSKPTYKEFLIPMFNKTKIPSGMLSSLANSLKQSVTQQG